MSSQQTAVAGRSAVERALTDRGWTVKQTKVDRRPVLLIQRDGVRRRIRVSAKRRGTWQTSATYGAKEAPAEFNGRFWIFVDLGDREPEFFVVPEGWMAEDIYARHSAYLARHGGSRPYSPKSMHHSIRLDRIEKWHDSWDLLKAP